MGFQKFDPSFDLVFRRHQQLDAIFSPKGVAVIGATEREGSVGRTVLWNLIRSPFGATIYPINPKRSQVLGIPAYPSITKVPEIVDLAIIVTPSHTVPGIIEECVEKKVPGAIIISAGFRELGKSGQELEDKIMQLAQKGKMRIIGPNCLGVMNPIIGLNATFAADIALKGNVAFISQSGALCTAVLDWSLKEKVGFSAFISIGSMMDVGWGDLIQYLGNDPNTKSILIYMESIGDPRSFLSAAREISLSKPIILIKAGITEESAKAAISHTGALTGSNEVVNAALNRVGILRVDSILELFSMAQILARQPRPKGPSLAIITNAGGPGVIATDALIQSGGKLAELSKNSFDQLDQVLPREWSKNNPIDILGDAQPERYEKAVQILVEEEKVDGILAILTPQYMTNPSKTAERISVLDFKEKPLLASWMGGNSVAEGIKKLEEQGIPTFDYPDAACKTFGYMWSHRKNLELTYESPTAFIEEDEMQQKLFHDAVAQIFQKARMKNQTILTEYESKRILEIYGIPTVPTYIAHTIEEAVSSAKKIGYPVVLKLFSETITHKTDVEGVKLDLNDNHAVRYAYEKIHDSVKRIVGEQHFQGVTVQKMLPITSGYELILGSNIDTDFGPVLLFGMGGQLVEIFKDRALGLPPLNSTLARRMMERTKIFQALKGVRGRKPVDLKKLEQILVRFSTLIAEFPEVKECDINPLLVTEKEIIALDARFVLFESTKPKEKLPKLAIRPYPSQYVHLWKLKDQTELLVRPIRAEDEQMIIDYFKDLSSRSLFKRYMKETAFDELIAKERLVRICFNDYDREIALVVEYKDPKTKRNQILGVGRLTKIAGTKEATFAIMVRDRWQKKGIGTHLLNQLIKIAKDEKIELLIARMLPESLDMKRICEKCNFRITFNEKDQVFLAELPLT